MHLVCLGPTDTGRPTVIFEAGLGGDFSVWGDVITPISDTDRACSYDRAGVGMSEPAPAPRTTADEVADLRTLLDGAGIAPPYVLVGHSIGGWNVLVHADEHPDDIVGAVLVDARPPEATDRWLAALPPEAPAESDAIRGNREELTTFEQDPTRNPEGLDLIASAKEVVAASGFGSDPLVVLTAANDETDLWEGIDPALAATMHGIWIELQEGLAARSTAGRLVVVEDAGHFIQLDQPRAVVDAIREVIGKAGG
jgi:pimeloyl-ACP methyl ester carboxylesterase